MLIDYLSKEQAFPFGMKEDAETDQIVFRGERTFSNITFANFPSLTFEELTFKNCTFKDCREVFFTALQLKDVNLKTSLLRMRNTQKLLVVCLILAVLRARY